MCAGDLQEGDLGGHSCGDTAGAGTVPVPVPMALQSSHTWGVLADLCIPCALKDFAHPLSLPMLWLCYEPEVTVNFRALLAAFG